MDHQGREGDSPVIYMKATDTWVSYPALSYDKVPEVVDVWREKAYAVLQS